MKIIRNKVGVCRISNFGRIRVSEEHAAKFLHGNTTNDIKGLVLGKGLGAAFLERNGKMWAYGHIFRVEEQALLVTTLPFFRKKIFETLDQRVISERVIVEDKTEETGAIRIEGPETMELLQEFGFSELPEVCFGAVRSLWKEQEMTFLRENFSGEIGMTLIVPKDMEDELYVEVLGKVEERGGIAFDQKDAEILRIEAGIPAFSQEIDESCNPIEAGLEGWISYTKGCYVGQESISSLHYRGGIKRMLSCVIYDGNPGNSFLLETEDGQELRKGNVCKSTALDAYAGLALVPFLSNEKEISLSLRWKNEVHGTGSAKAHKVPMISLPEDSLMRDVLQK